MLNVWCAICKNRFYAKPNLIRKGWGKYCSMACKREGQKTGKIMCCFICRRDVYKTGKALRGSKSKRYFCSKSCQTKWRNAIFVGEKHGNWKHGKNAYRSVLTRNGIPRICTLCNTQDIRILAVHHVDRNRKNNRLNNLVWLCHNCHFLVHHDKNEKAKFNIARMASEGKIH